MDEETGIRKAGQTPARYMIVMAVIVVATVLVVWLLPDDSQETSPDLPDLPATQMTDADLFRSADGDPAALLEGDRARAFIAGLRSDGSEPDADTVFVEAIRLKGEGYAVDAYLLFRYAANHGHEHGEHLRHLEEHIHELHEGMQALRRELDEVKRHLRERR